jgi:hypothetical protein
MDIRNVFLHGTLEEHVYMTLPSGHEKEEGTNMACKLIKLI